MQTKLCGLGDKITQMCLLLGCFGRIVQENLSVFHGIGSYADSGMFPALIFYDLICSWRMMISD